MKLQVIIAEEDEDEEKIEDEEKKEAEDREQEEENRQNEEKKNLEMKNEEVEVGEVEAENNLQTTLILLMDTLKKLNKRNINPMYQNLQFLNTQMIPHHR